MGNSPQLPPMEAYGTADAECPAGLLRAAEAEERGPLRRRRAVGWAVLGLALVAVVAFAACHHNGASSHGGGGQGDNILVKTQPGTRKDGQTCKKNEDCEKITCSFGICSSWIRTKKTGEACTETNECVRVNGKEAACVNKKCTSDKSKFKQEGAPIKASGNEAEIGMYFTFCTKAYETCRGHGDNGKLNAGLTFCPSTSAKGAKGCQECVYKYMKDNCDQGGNEPCHLNTMSNHQVSCYYSLAKCENDKMCYDDRGLWKLKTSCRSCMFKQYMANYKKASNGQLVAGQQGK